MILHFTLSGLPLIDIEVDMKQKETRLIQDHNPQISKHIIPVYTYSGLSRKLNEFEGYITPVNVKHLLKKIKHRGLKADGQFNLDLSIEGGDF